MSIQRHLDSIILPSGKCMTDSTDEEICAYLEEIPTGQVAKDLFHLVYIIRGMAEAFNIVRELPPNADGLFPDWKIPQVGWIDISGESEESND